LINQVSFKLGIIGFGNIAKAIVNPLLEKKFINPEQIYCIVKSNKSFDDIRNSYPYKINVILANSIDSKLVWDAPIKILSVKPQQLEELIELPSNKNKKDTIVSVLAGVSLKKLERKFPNHNCVRTVTNIPILLGKGLTGITWGSSVDEDKKIFIKKIFEKSSKIYELPEDYLDIFLSLTASAPAIIALIVDSLSDGGLSGGLNKKLSEELVIEMIFGTILLLKESNIGTTELKNMVTSPGGTTISALNILEKRSFKSALIEAIIAARNKSKEFS
tara:strand:+ start:6476 stop:7300 length:825 start_codon:yes stop_codon:yes gene_type:complete